MSAFVSRMATFYDGRLVISTGTNHDQYTLSGNVSDHYSGNGVDLGMAANGGTDDGPVGDRIAAAAFLAAGLPRDVAIARARAGGAQTIVSNGLRIQIIWKIRRREPPQPRPRRHRARRMTPPPTPVDCDARQEARHAPSPPTGGSEIPRWPTITARLHADGSGHLTIDGRDEQLAAGDLDAARATVLERVTATAATVARPVRLHSSDPDGDWELAVHPDGHVDELAATPTPTRAAVTPTQRRCAKRPRAAAAPPAPLRARRRARRTSGAARRRPGARRRVPRSPSCAARDPHQRARHRRPAADRAAASSPAPRTRGRHRRRAGRPSATPRRARRAAAARKRRAQRAALAPNASRCARPERRRAAAAPPRGAPGERVARPTPAHPAPPARVFAARPPPAPPAAPRCGEFDLC